MIESLKEKVLRITLEELDLSVRSYNCLKRAGINTVKDITEKTYEDMLTPILLRELIEKIEVFPVEGKGKDRTQRVIIYYRFVGRLDIPGIIQRPHFILDSRQGVAIEYLPNAI